VQEGSSLHRTLSDVPALQMLHLRKRVYVEMKKVGTMRPRIGQRVFIVVDFFNMFARGVRGFVWICVFLAGMNLFGYPLEEDGQEITEESDSEVEQGDHCEDIYLEGYIQASLNAYYYEYDVLVRVKYGEVFLYNLPNNSLVRNRIICFVRSLPRVRSVYLVSPSSREELDAMERWEKKPGSYGVWFPLSPPLYPAMLANPKEATSFATYRIGQEKMGPHTVVISLGDLLPVFRLNHLFRGKGAWEIGILGGVSSVYKMGVQRENEGSELITSDYITGCFTSLSLDHWIFRLRFCHISSHLGDEHMHYNPNLPRRNACLEGFDFFISYYLSDKFRCYGGVGWTSSDQSYPIDPWYVEYGLEARLFRHRSVSYKLYGNFLCAAYWRNWQAHLWSLDQTYILGYELGRFYLGHKMCLYLIWHCGYSEGQFFKERTKYWGCGVSWGF